VLTVPPVRTVRGDTCQDELVTSQFSVHRLPMAHRVVLPLQSGSQSLFIIFSSISVGIAHATLYTQHLSDYCITSMANRSTGPYEVHAIACYRSENHLKLLQLLKSRDKHLCFIYILVQLLSFASYSVLK
jgi:hypothetical protein